MTNKCPSVELPKIIDIPCGNWENEIKRIDIIPKINFTEEQRREMEKQGIVTSTFNGCEVYCKDEYGNFYTRSFSFISRY
jgi:hypothetical protein